MFQNVAHSERGFLAMQELLTTCRIHQATKTIIFYSQNVLFPRIKYVCDLYIQKVEIEIEAIVSPFILNSDHLLVNILNAPTPF